MEMATLDHSKAFNRPFAHLRHAHPETYKRMIAMKELEDPPPPGLGAKMLQSNSVPSLPRLPHGSSSGRSRNSSSSRGSHATSGGGSAKTRESRRDKRRPTEAQQVTEMRRLKAFGGRNQIGGLNDGMPQWDKVCTWYRPEHRE
mmetsp:Transcript_14446/g.26922  ORF Transcript_14446/g.26922 Transcript_14446/m.26922 type:complete len:144 (-) Transcript_14446:24-455(-)